MKENSNVVNDFVHKNTVTIKHGDATDKVPSVVKIFTSAVGNVSYGCLDNRAYDFLTDNSGTHVDVFKFPGTSSPRRTLVQQWQVRLKCMIYRASSTR